jgi:hypothetical protein
MVFLMAFEWFKQFKDGHEDLQDDPRSGCPSTTQNVELIANAREMVHEIIDGLSE